LQSNKHYKPLNYKKMNKKLFQRNLGGKERIIRLVIALLALSAWYFGVVAGVAAIIVGVIAIMLIGTSAAASCPMHSMTGINTMSQKERDELDTKGISYQKK
jgi:hypothetical protein